MKIAVYTVQIGDYDTLTDPVVVDNNYDYFCFSDHDIESKVWTIIKLDNSYFPSNIDNIRKSRWVKTHPHILLKDYDMTIYIDSNILILKSIKEFIDKNNFNMDSGWLLFKHPWRDCIYDEVIELNKWRVDYYKANNWYKKLEEEGYPRHNGLTENNFIVRMNDDKVNELNELWWNLIYKESYRDQLSLMYVFWKNKFTPNISNIVIRECDYFKHVEHKGR